MVKRWENIERADFLGVENMTYLQSSRLNFLEIQSLSHLTMLPPARREKIKAFISSWMIINLPDCGMIQTGICLCLENISMY